MNKYYFDFIKEKLKRDVIQELLLYDIDKTILLQEVDLYFKENKIELKECNGNTDKVRDRSAYKNRENMCKARIWNFGDGGQCSFTGTYNGFCKTHFDKGGDSWWLGTIVKPRPERPIKPDGTLLT